MFYVRKFLRAFLRPIAMFLFRIRVIGQMPEHENALLIIANHESFLDGVLLGLFLTADPVYVIHTSVKKHWYFRLILKLADHLLVDPTNAVAMKTVIKIIESGRSVVIFPEGRITTTGSLMKTYEGPAFVAAKTRATILPIRIDGASRSYFSRLSSQNPQKLLPKITIHVLPITQIDLGREPHGAEDRTQAAEMMRKLMQEMLFSSYPKQTLFESLLTSASIHGYRKNFIEDHKQYEYSYGDLIKMSLVFGRKTQQLTEENAYVGLLLPNSIATLAAIFGLTAFKRVPAVLNYTAGPDGMSSACQAANINLVLTSRTFIAQGKLEPLIDALSDRQIVYLEDIKKQMTIKDIMWLYLWAIHFPRAATLDASPDSIAITLFTSGTEGKPKGVLLSHQAISANIAQIRAIIDVSVHDKFLNVLPFFHSFGLTAGGILPIICGSKLVLYPSPLHYKVIPEIAYDRNCTVLLGTSTFLGNYGKHAHPYDFYKLRYVIVGAEKLSTAVSQLWFEKFGIRILEGYGITEMSPVLSVNTPMAYRSGTVGQLLPGIHHQLTSVEGVDTGGKLHVKAPNMMTGYLKVENPGVVEAPSSELGDSWYDTGDLVEIDEDGFIRIVGRLKRFSKIAGEMVSLEVVETIAKLASPDFFHASTTKEDSARGEAIVLFTTDNNLTREQLINIVQASGYPEIALPRKIMIIDELPLLGSGKTDYVSLKKMAETV